MSNKPGEEVFDYDVALSFAGEQREFVREVAASLSATGVRCFYDEAEKANLWGKDLYEHLDWIYGKAARFCVLFASKEYAQKVWTTHERKSAQARAIGSSSEYVLPARFDDTEIPGLRSTIGHVDLRDTSASELADLIRQKLGPRRKQQFLPPQMDILLDALDLESEAEESHAEAVARSFMRTLTRMTPEERILIAHIFTEGCDSELPNNVHMSLDLIRRDIGITPSQSLEMLRMLSSLGFDHQVRDDSAGHGDDTIAIEWRDVSVYVDDDRNDFAMALSTVVAMTMLDVGQGDQCRECAKNCIIDLDFSQLSSATQ